MDRVLGKLERLSNQQLVAGMLSVSMLLVGIGWWISRTDGEGSRGEKPTYMVGVGEPLLSEIVDEMSSGEIKTAVVDHEGETGDRVDLILVLQPELPVANQQLRYNLSESEGLRITQPGSHYWFSVSNALILQKTIRDLLSGAYPELRIRIDTNLMRMNDELIAVDRKWRPRFQEKYPAEFYDPGGKLAEVCQDFGISVIQDSRGNEARIPGRLESNPALLSENSTTIRVLGYDAYGSEVAATSYPERIDEIYATMYSLLISGAE